jgi:hypothetical protein
MAAGDRAGSEKRSWARALQPIEVMIEVVPNIEVPTQRRQRSAGCSRERETTIEGQLIKKWRGAG